MQLFEHKVIQVWPQDTKDILQDELDAHSLEGWELVSVVSKEYHFVLFFKRPFVSAGDREPVNVL